MMITMFISMVIFLLMGFVFIKMNSYYSEQFIREHVINYGNMAMVEINSLFKHANEISISNLQGISRIRFMNPDGSSDIVSVNRENGFFLNDIPMIGRTSSFGQSDVNYFNYDEDNKIEFKISSFDCDYVPANTGLSGKLSQTMYRLHLIIEVVKVVNGSEITTDFEFKKDIFAVIEYLS
ncbi:MAG: hypothetical protein HQ510_10115 [Candidatus Marinimicrobia bacterium]|nr:hypothetical protein [Candidatus Neomarinimicrobiota bacterium]